MTITRQNVADYLNTQFSGLAEAVGQSATPLTGYKPDIDAALRKLGTVEGDLATAEVVDGSRDAYFALAEYYAARRFWRQLGNRVNTRTGSTSYNFDGQLKAAKGMMEDAANRLAILGYDVTGGGWSTGELNLDWIENESVVDA